jgi:hypothetical protein
MAPGVTTRAQANWAVDRATGLPEVWALVAKHLGLVGAWRLVRVCVAARAGAKEFLRTLPGLVVCGGRTSGGAVRDVRRLDLATLRWEPMLALVNAESGHACCAARGTVVVLGGVTSDDLVTSTVEMLSEAEGEGAFVNLPPLSCGAIYGAAAIAVEESESAAGKVILLGGVDEHDAVQSAVHLVDLATGACTRQAADLLHPRYTCAAARLPDGGIVCAGGAGTFFASSAMSSAEVCGPSEQGGLEAAWTWTELPSMSVQRYGCRGCVMSDGRFAVIGGRNINNVEMPSCEALVSNTIDDAHWTPLQPMHEPRVFFACAAVAGCVIVAGGFGSKSAEVYDEVLDRWLWLPCDLPCDGEFLSFTGSALL